MCCVHAVADWLSLFTDEWRDAIFIPNDAFISPNVGTQCMACANANFQIFLVHVQTVVQSELESGEYYSNICPRML